MRPEPARSDAHADAGARSLRWRKALGGGAAIAVAAIAVAAGLACWSGTTSVGRVALLSLAAGAALVAVAGMLSGAWISLLEIGSGGLPGAGPTVPPDYGVARPQDRFGFPRLARVVLVGALITWGAAAALIMVAAL